MPFINNSKFKTINEAGRNGNEIAKKILQALRKGEKQEDIDNLVLEFYGINENKPVENEEEVEAIDNNGEEEKEELFEDLTKDEEEAVDAYEQAVTKIKEMDVLEKDSIIDLINHIKEEEQEHIKELKEAYEVSEGEKDASELQEDVNEEKPNDGLEIEDLTDALNQELDGLIDENEIDDETFSQFLANKKRDKLRSLKNNEYFKIYNPASKEKYINDKVKAYNDKFSGLLKNHDRSFRDFDNGINYYLKEANLFLDDDLPLDNDKVSEIYEKITSDDDIVNSIGRIWDEDDKNNILGKLNEYTTLYGKKNLIPALNFVKEDNNAFKKYRNDKIDEEIKRYSGNLSKILK